MAVAWQSIFARTFHLALSVADGEALFLSAWLIYLIDRFADSVSLPATVPKSAREIFCVEHRHGWLVLIMAVALFDFAVVWSRLDRAILANGIVLAMLAVIYLATNFFLGRIWKVIPIKEILVGVLFAEGTLLVFFRSSATAGSTIVVAAVLFAALCALNCISIAVWERDLDQAQGKCSIATSWPATKVYAALASIFLVAAVGLFAFIDPWAKGLASCIGVSAALLATLHFAAARRDERTALADLVLLAPAAFLVLAKFW